MNYELNRFLDQSLQYNFNRGPLQINTLDQAKEKGLNCQTLVHLILKEHGIILPPYMRSKEIYENDELFPSIPTKGPIVFGDIFMFGQFLLSDPRLLHLAVATGESNAERSPLLIHANWHDKGVGVWPLNRFMNLPRYERLYAIKRYNGSTSNKIR